MNQEDLRSRLLIELDCVTLDALAVARGLQEPQLHWRPSSGWSVGQLFEHVVLANDSYLNRIRGEVYRPGAVHIQQGVATWEPTLMGWLLVKGLRAKRKLLAPKIYQPEPTPRAEVVEAFLQRQRTLMQLLRASAALDWNRVHTTSPVSRLVRLNLGDVFTVIVTHAQRHIKQMEKVRDQTDFPA